MFFRWPWKRKPDNHPGREQGREVYGGLRVMARSGTREEVGLPPLPPNAPVWRVLMEFELEVGAVTLLGCLSGGASLYFGTGGGILGGEGHAAVREAAINLMQVANQHLALFEPATEVPLPRRGWMTFYLRTEGKTLTATAPKQELVRGSHSLSQLFLAANDLVTQLRIVTER